MAEESTDTLLAPENNELDGGSTSEDSVRNSDFPTNGNGADLLLAPESNELDEGSMDKDRAEDLDFRTFLSSPNHGGASSDFYHIGGSSRRNSAGMSDSAFSIQKVVPRYLRASMGSCHDFCKYGRKHEFEEKPWKPLRRKVKLLSSNPNLVQLTEPKKKQSAMRRSLTDINKRSSDPKPSPETKRKLMRSKQNSSTDGVEHSPDLKHSPSTKYYARTPKTPKLKSSPDTKNHSPNLQPSPDSKYDSPRHMTAKKKSSTFTSSPLPDLKPTPDSNVSSPKLKASKKKISTNANDWSPDLKPSPETRYRSPKPNTSKKNSSNDTNNHSTDLKPSPDAQVYARKPKISLDAKTYLRNVLTRNNTSVVHHKPLPTKRSPSLDPPEVIKREIALPSEPFDVLAIAGSSTEGRTTGTEKTTGNHSNKVSSPMKLKTVKGKLSLSSGNSDGMHGKGESNRDVKTGRKVTAPRASVKKSSPLGATSSSKLLLSKTASSKARVPGTLKFVPLKDRSRISRTKPKISDNEKVPEKTLHVVKLETEKDVVESSSSDHPLPSSSPVSNKNDDEESKYSGGEAELASDNKDTVELGKVQPMKDNNKALRKSRVVGSEDKYRSPVKLKFRSGKVMDLNPVNTAPRRLKFRRARAQGIDDGNGDLRRRAYKRGGGNADVSGSDLSSVKVVLKHQDVQGKKDAQGLFNNVIEETASKLVESRKSKVKALVGAFETVISLQESKPS